ncbi:MAG: hypothetical protein J7L96_10220, partial [Bacteroidales bacterium]|nr:hypothetical protein [Bacteroidales bacterium]
MKTKSLLALILVLISLSSCKMQSFMLDVYEPAGMDLPPEIRTFVAVSRFVPATGDYDDVKWGHYQSVDSLVLRVSDSCLAGFSKEFSSFGRYAVRNPKGYRMFHHNGDSLPEALPWKGLIAICQKQYADAIALLEGFSIRQERADINDLTNEDSSGFIAEQKVVVTAAWRIEQPIRHRMLDENVYTFSKSFTGKGATREEALA